MLLSIKHLSGYKIEATDGDIGKAHTFLIDDQRWIVRYVVVDTGGWLKGRKVLIAPESIMEPDGKKEHLPVHLSKTQVESSPEIDSDMPVSRRQEIKLYQHYQWSPYWTGGVTPIGPAYIPQPSAVEAGAEEGAQEEQKVDEDADPHLRSTREIINYNIHASDGEIGHVEDFIVDVRDWAIRYMVVDTRNWLPGKKVIIAPDWIKDINWAESSVTVQMTRESIKDSPEYDPALPINMEYEARLYDYYGRPAYWD
jgi:hypothetical protein